MNAKTKSTDKKAKIDSKKMGRNALSDKLRSETKRAESWKAKCKEMERKLKQAEEMMSKVNRVQEAVERSRKKVPKHSYSQLHADLAVKIRTKTSCGARDVSTIMEILNEETGGLLDDDIPCPNTIDGWVAKCGLDALAGASSQREGESYAMIVDDSMMVGGQRLLLILLVPANHKGRPLTHGDVRIGGIYVEKSFNADYIKNALEETAAKVGRKPEYVICDNASIMVKGTKLSGMSRHSDITHSLGMFLERTYKKEPDFSAYVKEMTDVTFKNNMLPIAYLLPPRQRSIARFINIDGWVKWSSTLLDRMESIPRDERAAFSFVPRNASLIEELQELMSCVRFIEKKYKWEGLSLETTAECREKINSMLMRGNERMRRLGSAVDGFLCKETEIVEGGVHNNSSDIIESLFGNYKAMRSPNKMYGVTSLILRLPLRGKTAGKDYDVAQSLTRVRMCDIEEWKSKNLLPNLVSKRLRFFAKTA